MAGQGDREKRREGWDDGEHRAGEHEPSPDALPRGSPLNEGLPQNVDAAPGNDAIPVTQLPVTPMPVAESPVTQLLSAVSRGDSVAADALWRTVYTELRRMAAGQLAAERAGLTLQPTALVHEVFLKLVGADAGPFDNRRHFFAAAARAMRCIRIDDARKRKRLKRGGGRAQSADADALDGGVPLPLGSGSDADADADMLLALDEALDRLRVIDPLRAEVVEHRYFVGLSIDETAAAMGVSPRTVDAHWRFARAWLHRELGETEPRP